MATKPDSVFLSEDSFECVLLFTLIVLRYFLFILFTFYFVYVCSVFWLFFRLDALAKALSVIATATWLAGWVAGWLAGCHTPVLYQNR